LVVGRRSERNDIVTAPQFPPDPAPAVTGRTLRQFAALCVGVLGCVFLASWYRHGEPTTAAWIALILGSVIGVPGLIRPGFIRPFYLGAMGATRPVGYVMSTVVLAAIYYGVLTPIAVLFRLGGRDVLGLRKREADSYWIDLPRRGEPREYLRQYQRQPTTTRR
jgi:hypothetical protein